MSDEETPPRCPNGRPHDKVFAMWVYATCPVQYPWICRRCGCKGIDRGQDKQLGLKDEYERLVDYFNRMRIVKGKHG